MDTKALWTSGYGFVDNKITTSTKLKKGDPKHQTTRSTVDGISSKHIKFIIKGAIIIIVKAIGAIATVFGGTTYLIG